MKDRIDYISTLAIAVANKYGMSARDAIGIVMTSKYADASIDSLYMAFTTETIDNLVANI